jgi:hypothetical protein
MTAARNVHVLATVRQMPSIESMSGWSSVLLTLKTAARAPLPARCRIAARRSGQRAAADVSRA